MEISLVTFTPDDQQAFKNLVLNSLKDFGFDYNPHYDSDLDDPAIYAKKGGVLFLLKFDNQVIGSLAVIKHGKTAELKRWYVAKEYRGKGFGSLLMDKAIKFCRDNGFAKIEFETNRKFTKAHKLYKSKGFRVFKEDSESLYMSKKI